jgi:hypothetical protein
VLLKQIQVIDAVRWNCLSTEIYVLCIALVPRAFDFNQLDFVRHREIEQLARQ